MRFFKNYSYPFFLSLSGAMATLSDVLQNGVIAHFVIVMLIIAAAIAFVARYFGSLNATILESLPEKVRDNFAHVPFAVSCLILAVFVGGFSALSAKASSDGGVIASSFPEVREMQAKLGLIHESTARIEDSTSRILDATRQWISIMDAGYTQSNDLNDDGTYTYIDYYYLNIENNTPFLFKRLSGILKSSNDEVIEFGDFALASDNYRHEKFTAGPTAADQLTLCVVADQAKDDTRIREQRFYRKDRDVGNAIMYALADVIGPEIVPADTECER